MIANFLEKVLIRAQGYAPTVTKFLAYGFILLVVGTLVYYLSTPVVILLGVLVGALLAFVGLSKSYE